MSGFRLRVISMRQDIAEPKNSGSFLVLETKSGGAKKGADTETLLLVAGIASLFLVIAVGVYLIFAKR